MIYLQRQKWLAQSFTTTFNTLNGIINKLSPLLLIFWHSKLH